MIGNRNLRGKIKVYLDVCCLSRPFDDQTQDKVRLESEAVIAILKQVELGEILMVSSDAILYEISKIPDQGRREKIGLVISKGQIYVEVDRGIMDRSIKIQKLGIKSYDALHVACAERGKSDIFLTTDDKLLKKLKKYSSYVNIKAENPLIWMMELMSDETI